MLFANQFKLSVSSSTEMVFVLSGVCLLLSLFLFFTLRLYLKTRSELKNQKKKYQEIESNILGYTDSGYIDYSLEKWVHDVTWRISTLKDALIKEDARSQTIHEPLIELLSCCTSVSEKDRLRDKAEEFLNWADKIESMLVLSANILDESVAKGGVVNLNYAEEVMTIQAYADSVREKHSRDYKPETKTTSETEFGGHVGHETSATTEAALEEDSAISWGLPDGAIVPPAARAVYNKSGKYAGHSRPIVLEQYYPIRQVETEVNGFDDADISQIYSKGRGKGVPSALWQTIENCPDPVQREHLANYIKTHKPEWGDSEIRNSLLKREERFLKSLLLQVRELMETLKATHQAGIEQKTEGELKKSFVKKTISERIDEALELSPADLHKKLEEIENETNTSSQTESTVRIGGEMTLGSSFPNTHKRMVQIFNAEGKRIGEVENDS